MSAANSFPSYQQQTGLAQLQASQPVSQAHEAAMNWKAAKEMLDRTQSQLNAARAELDAATQSEASAWNALESAAGRDGAAKRDVPYLR